MAECIIEAKYISLLCSCSQCVVPSSPQNVQAQFVNNPPECTNNVNVTWDSPEEGDVDSYFVECVSNNNTLSSNVSGTQTSAVFGNFSIPRLEYNCSVVAINSFGASEPGFSDPFTTQ